MLYLSLYPTLNKYFLSYTRKNSAPGEARTHNLRMTYSAITALAEMYTDYKYGALTDCATGAHITNRILSHEKCNTNFACLQ